MKCLLCRYRHYNTLNVWERIRNGLKVALCPKHLPSLLRK